MVRTMVLCLITAPLAAQQTTVAWFTDADVPGVVSVAGAPDLGLPVADGTVGDGVELTHTVVLEMSGLRREQGIICLWVYPQWPGDDGRSHRVLRIGDPGRNGLLLEKSENAMLRFVMASPEKRVVARADVSQWRPGEWHQVVLAWMSREGSPTGLALWIDRVAVDGPVGSGCTFLDPETMDDASLLLGDDTSECAVDELVVRDAFDSEGNGQVGLVYRDYFRCAPYDRVQIDPDSSAVPSDRRVVAGHAKQFGLQARRPDGELGPVTDFTVRYGCWSNFDAKPFITWRTSDESIATVDEGGLVTGVKPGRCELTATFRGMEDDYDINVIPVDQPDLDLTHLSLLPRYRANEPEDRPAPGDPVTLVANIVNAGFEPSSAGVEVRFELIEEGNDNFHLDQSELDRAKLVATARLGEALKPRERATVDFAWEFTERPVWMRVVIDPAGRIDETCEANNEIADLSTARPLRFGYDQAFYDSCFDDRKINLVGSFSYSDYIHAQKRRMDLMLREAVYPETSAVGVRDAYRIDLIYPLPGEGEDELPEAEEAFYDGGFPVGSHAELMALDSGLIHEFGHTCLALPDLYGYGVRPCNVLLMDDAGEPYAGGPLLPEVQRDILPYSRANNVPTGVGYTPLMDFCHLWLHPAHAGKVDYFAGYRGPRFWGVQGHLIPRLEHTLDLRAFDDEPLVNAAVYVYHVSQTAALDAGTKFVADIPKFTGHTDVDGRFVFANETDPGWDDPETDAVEGAIAVWNPFDGVMSDMAFTPNVWEVEGLLLIRIVSGDATEFAWLSLTDLNQAFFTGQLHRGIYTIRTSLESSEVATPIARPERPEAVRDTNLRPISVTTTRIQVACGEEFTLDASASYDPEGQPLLYRWTGPSFRTEPILRLRAPDRPGEVRYKLHVIDGVRPSEPVEVVVQAE